MNLSNLGVASAIRVWHHAKAKLLILMIMTASFGCNSEESTGGVRVIVSNGYYVRTTTDSGPVYLAASRLYGSQRVGGANLETIPLENAAVAWRITGEETLIFRSQSSFIESASNLVVRANDGQMQIAMVDDGDAISEFANWRLVPLDNGRCHLVNVDLGSDLALNVANPVVLPDGSARYSVEMVGIDDALNQQDSLSSFAARYKSSTHLVCGACLALKLLLSLVLE